jgi:hypothetical protein
MIIGAEIGLFIYGIIVLISGQYGMGKGRKLFGGKARLIGAICLLPMPLSAVTGFVIGFVNADAGLDALKGWVVGAEAAILVCVVLTIVLLSKMFFKQQQTERA